MLNSFFSKIFKKKITIMIIPHHGLRVFQVRLPVFFASIILLIISWVIFYSVHIVKSDIDYKVALASIQTLKEKSFVLNEEFNRIQERVRKFAEQEKKLKEMLGYKNKKALIEEKGLGGPAKSDQNVLENLLNSAVKKEDVKNTFDNIIAEIEFSEQSFKEVEKHVSNLRSIWSATPKGWPVKGYHTSTFGYRKMMLDYMGDADSKVKDWHAGEDIANKTGTKIKTTADGKVVYAGRLGGYGLLVIINHGYGFTTRYAHASKILVKKGDEVKAGDAIALIGVTGNTTGPHVHYEVRKYEKAIDPRKVDSYLYK